jgi:hypothetical protein
MPSQRDLERASKTSTTEKAKFRIRILRLHKEQLSVWKLVAYELLYPALGLNREHLVEGLISPAAMQ